jgi:hypothetical protein
MNMANESSAITSSTPIRRQGKPWIDKVQDNPDNQNNKSNGNNKLLPPGNNKVHNDTVTISERAMEACEVAGDVVRGIGVGALHALIEANINTIDKTTELVTNSDDSDREKKTKRAIILAGAGIGGFTGALGPSAIMTPLLGPLVPAAQFGIGLTLGIGGGAGAAGTLIMAAEGAIEGAEKGENYAADVGKKAENKVVREEDKATAKTLRKATGKAAKFGATVSSGLVAVPAYTTYGALKKASDFNNKLMGIDDYSDTELPVVGTMMAGETYYAIQTGLGHAVSVGMGLTIPGKIASIQGTAEGFAEGFREGFTRRNKSKAAEEAAQENNLNKVKIPDTPETSNTENN